MAKRRIYWGIFGLLLVFGLVLTGCKNDGGDPDPAPAPESPNPNPNPDPNPNPNPDPDPNPNPSFTPPTKADLQAFFESYRTDTANEISGENAAVYIKSITLNTYTIGGTSITTKPDAVSEDADVKVKFTIRTILGFDNLTMGERLQIDNFRVSLMGALNTWLKQKGFKSVPSANITTGNTVFG
jgi:hypothetical protein